MMINHYRKCWTRDGKQSPTLMSGFARKVVFDLSFAVRCAAAALHRRKLGTNVGLRPRFDNSKKAVRGVAPNQIIST